MQLLMTEADYAQVGMRPAVGRLANAMIAALGPELRHGSPAYNQCRAIIREMQVRSLPYAALNSRLVYCRESVQSAFGLGSPDAMQSPTPLLKRFHSWFCFADRIDALMHSRWRAWRVACSRQWRW